MDFHLDQSTGLKMNMPKRKKKKKREREMLIKKQFAIKMFYHLFTFPYLNCIVFTYPKKDKEREEGGEREWGREERQREGEN